MEENLELEAEEGSSPSSCDPLNVDLVPNVEVVNCSFVIDMHTFPHGPNQKHNQTPGITKSFSRKGTSQRGEKKLMISSNYNAAVRDHTDPLILVSSPKGMVGTSTPEKGDHQVSGSHKVYHQIAITGVAAETSKLGLRRNSFKRAPPHWLLDPKRILFFFATISSIGTILLIFFTLTTSKMNGDEDSLHDLQT